MAIGMLDEDEKLRELPCLILAIMAHAALLSTQLPRWGSPVPPKTDAVAVDFVASLPPEPVIPEPAPSPNLAPVPAGADKEGTPSRGPGPLVVEEKPAPAKIVKAPRALKRAPTGRRASAPRRSLTASVRAANDRVREQRLLAAKRAALELAETRAAEAQAQKRELERRTLETRRQAQALAAARERQRADASLRLAALADPDEPLSDAVADRPSAGPAAGSAAGRGAEQALLASATQAAPMQDGDEPLYTLEEDGRGSKRVKGAGGGAGPDGGGLSWALEGPAGGRRLMQRALPAGPSWLAERGLEPTVSVKFQVLPDGGVKPGAVIKKTSGFPEIDRRALEALKRWRFAPAKDDAPETWGVVTFRFLM